jgi:hypothetical protein
MTEAYTGEGAHGELRRLRRAAQPQAKEAIADHLERTALAGAP